MWYPRFRSYYIMHLQKLWRLTMAFLYKYAYLLTKNANKSHYNYVILYYINMLFQTTTTTFLGYVYVRASRQHGYANRHSIRAVMAS